LHPRDKKCQLVVPNAYYYSLLRQRQHNRHEKQHNPKYKSKNIHKHTQIIKPNEQKSPRLALMTLFDMTVETPQIEMTALIRNDTKWLMERRTRLSEHDIRSQKSIWRWSV